MANTVPSPTAGAGDDKEFSNYTGGPQGPKMAGSVIGGTHNVSVKVDPDAALRGEFTPIPGDTMPSGTPTGGITTGKGPVLPEN